MLAVTGGSVVLGGSSQLAINFTGSALAPDSSNPFWQGNRTWKILSIGGSASNPGPTAFPTIANGTFAAGSFTNYADAGGNIILAFVPNATVPTNPKVGTVSKVGTNLVMSGSGGSAGHTYYLVSSSSITNARNTWVTNATGTFDGSGDFIITNAINPADLRRFYDIKYFTP